MKISTLTRWIVMLLFLSWPFSQALAGTISGKVKVKGLRSAANILIYLNKAPQPELDISNAKFSMDQQNLTFIPHVLPIPLGATVKFPNNDKVDHNVFSLSRTKKFNLGSYKPGQSQNVVFDKPGIVELRCDVHAEMLAYIMVMKNPYFAVTDDQGRFTIPDARYLESHGITGIKDLPAGAYTLKNRHEKLKTDKQKVTVPADGAVEVELDLTRGRPSVLYK
ncbi:MAG: carboxypeptidase regulatory-like domain-containing protein [Desulfobacteraceae bacterium]